jgi:hypothetical protein
MLEGKTWFLTLMREHKLKIIIEMSRKGLVCDFKFAINLDWDLNQSLLH